LFRLLDGIVCCALCYHVLPLPRLVQAPAVLHGLHQKIMSQLPQALEKVGINALIFVPVSHALLHLVLLPSYVTGHSVTFRSLIMTVALISTRQGVSAILAATTPSAPIRLRIKTPAATTPAPVAPAPADSQQSQAPTPMAVDSNPTPAPPPHPAAAAAASPSLGPAAAAPAAPSGGGLKLRIKLSSSSLATAAATAPSQSQSQPQQQQQQLPPQ